jgi:hypothetical protein
MIRSDGTLRKKKNDLAENIEKKGDAINGRTEREKHGEVYPSPLLDGGPV